MELHKKIEKKLESIKDEPFSRLTASTIGNPCSRALWYDFNATYTKTLPARVRLTTRSAKLIKDMLLDLFMNEFTITPHYTSVCKEYPKFQGHADGVLLDKYASVVSLIEIKVARDSSFNTFQKKGTRLWYPEYYDKAQACMGMSDIHMTTMIVFNKDTGEIGEEILGFDNDRYQQLVEKAKLIGESSEPPDRINISPSYFMCKGCGYRTSCHAGYR